jgi:hypothetical protein
MTAYNGATSLKENVQADSSSAAPYYRSFAPAAPAPQYGVGYTDGYTDGYAQGLLDATGVVYRMRAYDSGLAPPRYVYWNSVIVDDLGTYYTGPGPISDVVVQNIQGIPVILLVPGTGFEAMPEQWVKLNVPANQAATPMFAQVSTNFDTIKAIRDGSIVGLGTRLSEAVTAGLLTVTVTINGTPGTLSIAHTSGTGGVATQATGIDNYVAGDLIGIQYSTNAGFLPITADLEAWLQVVEVP